MLDINKRSFGADTMEELKKVKEIQKNRFFKRWEGYNNISYDYKELNNNILIQSQLVYSNNNDLIIKETHIYNINNKKVIIIKGIATLDLFQIPIDIKYYNI